MWKHELILCRMDKDHDVMSNNEKTTTTTTKKKKKRKVINEEDEDDDDDDDDDDDEEEKLELAQGENWLKLRIITSSSILQTQEDEEEEEEEEEQEEASLTQVSQRATQDPPPPTAATTTTKNTTTNSNMNINMNMNTNRPYLHTSILSIRNIGSMMGPEHHDYASPLQDCYICLDVVDCGGSLLTYRKKKENTTATTNDNIDIQQQEEDQQQQQQQAEDEEDTINTLDTDSILTIKDMRWPSKANDEYCNHGIIIQDNDNDINDINNTETTCIGIYRKHQDRFRLSGGDDTITINGWMCLKRRRLTILYPGDRICTDLQVVNLLCNKKNRSIHNNYNNNNDTVTPPVTSSYIKQYTLNGVILEYRPRYVATTAEYSQSQTQTTTQQQQQQQQIVFSQLSMSQLSQTQDEGEEQEEDRTQQQQSIQQQRQQNDEEQTILHPSLDTQQQQPQSQFHDENDGGKTITGTSVVPTADRQHPNDGDDHVDATTADDAIQNTNDVDDDDEREEEEEKEDQIEDQVEKDGPASEDDRSVASNDSDMTAPMSQLKQPQPSTMVGRTIPSSFHAFSNDDDTDDERTALDDIPEHDDDDEEEQKERMNVRQAVEKKQSSLLLDSKDDGTTKNDSTADREVLLTQPNDGDDDAKNNNKAVREPSNLHHHDGDDDDDNDDDDATELGCCDEEMEASPVDDGTPTRSKTYRTASTGRSHHATEESSVLLLSSSSPHKLYTQPSQENMETEQNATVNTDTGPPPSTPKVRRIETGTVTSPNLLLQDYDDKVPEDGPTVNALLPGIEDTVTLTTEASQRSAIPTGIRAETNIRSNKEKNQSMLVDGTNSILKELEFIDNTRDGQDPTGDKKFTVTDHTRDGQDPKISDKKKSPSKMSATDARTAKGLENIDNTHDDEDITDPEEEIQPNKDGLDVITITSTKQAGNSSVIDSQSNAASPGAKKDSSSNPNDDEPSTPQNEEPEDTVDRVSSRRRRKSQRTRASKVQEEHTTPTQNPVQSTGSSTRRGKRKASSPQDQGIVSNRKSRRTSINTTTTTENEGIRHETMLTYARHRYNQIFQSALDTGVVTIAVSSLSKSDVTILDYLLSKKVFMGGIKLKLSDDVDTDTTVCVVPHVVSNNKSRNVQATIRSKKAMKASLLGIPIVTPDWLQLCKKHGKIILPESFIQTLPTKSDAIEVNGDANFGVTRLAAEWKIRPDTPRLPFSNTFVYLCGNFKMPRNDLTDLLEEGCASMLLTPNATSSKLMELMNDTTTETSSSSKPLVAIVCGDSRVSFTKSLEQDINTAAVDTTLEVVVVGWQWVLESITCGKAMPASLFPPVAKKELWELCLGHI
ncbi:BRCA1 C Terminus BRCT domain containing protein [Nitzschia inconspicua]|uniref:BRCA1 C Terminus BRCT domain containing protein n=1 Tax=Nitzschia inconspicua TaxID=303405 RepID=A0A9K3PA34_9STRA|nr:BRCA1 C Terminus BRCT domain containing protein [Nitzschia inconspicua]